MKDRVDTDGNKTLLIEEAQSDWHQQGAEKGYANKTPPPELALIKAKVDQAQGDFWAFLEKNMDTTAQPMDMDRYDELISSGEGLRLKEIQKAAVDELMNGDVANKYNHELINAVPDAPFKTDDKSSWYNLAMKRGLLEAVEGGYDKMAITTGRQQADRYDLSKSINEVRLGGNEKDGFTVSAFDKNDKPVIMESIDTLDELPNLIGKDAAKEIVDRPVTKITSPDGDYEESRILAGQDLSIGGEGMKQFYDRTLPNALGKLVKQDGVKVGQSELSSPRLKKMLSRKDQEELTRLKKEFRTPAGLSARQLDRYTELNKKNNMQVFDKDTVHSIDITPKMRERVKKGLPMFATGGAAIGLGELMRQQQQEKEAGSGVLHSL
tara:strand:- start:24 stop:1163 length:1140 start_codon:yes stop_codon:yes gene_type:complete